MSNIIKRVVIVATTATLVIIFFLLFTTYYVTWEHAQYYYSWDNFTGSIKGQINIWKYGESHPKFV